MVEKIIHEDNLLSIIVRAEFHQEGIHFFTSNELSQQLAFMHYPKGKVIESHVHNKVSRQVFYTQEVLFIRRGKLRVDFYTDKRNYIESRILKSGDVIMLIEGGHGFEVLEELEMIEVKQGPYLGDQDKTRFSSASINEIKLPKND